MYTYANTHLPLHFKCVYRDARNCLFDKKINKKRENREIINSRNRIHALWPKCVDIRREYLFGRDGQPLLNFLNKRMRLQIL